MTLTPLGNGFAKLVVGDMVLYFFRASSIPAHILEMIIDIEHPTQADEFTCEMANM